MKKLIILFGILFLTGCGLTNDYKGTVSKIKPPISFKTSDKGVYRYGLRYIKEDEIHENNMFFHKDYIIIDVDETYYFNKTTKTLYIEENDALREIEVLDSSELEALLLKIETIKSIEFIKLDYKVNDIVNDLLSTKHQGIFYRKTSISRIPGMWSLEIKRNDLARFELLSKCFDQLNTFYTTEGSEIAIHIHTMDSISSVDSIDTVLSGRHEETLYKRRYGDTRKMSEKIKSLLD